MTWQPIETAPEDEYVLMFGMVIPDPSGLDDWVIWVGTKGGSVETTWPISEDAAIDATHWMPLPEPPTPPTPP